MTGVIQINWSNPNVRLKSARNCQITASNELSGAWRQCVSHNTHTMRMGIPLFPNGMGAIRAWWGVTCVCLCVCGGRRSVRACGDAKQLEICMCHESVRVCVTPDWAEREHTHSTQWPKSAGGLRYMCVKQYSFRLNDWTNEGLTKGREQSRAAQSNSSRQEATCICTHCCGQYWPNTSTVCGLDPPKPKPNHL